VGGSRSRHQSVESARTVRSLPPTQLTRPRSILSSLKVPPQSSSRAPSRQSASSRRTSESDQHSQRDRSESAKDIDRGSPASPHGIQDPSRESSDEEHPSNPRSDDRSSSHSNSGNPHARIDGSRHGSREEERSVIEAHEDQEHNGQDSGPRTWKRKKVPPFWRIKDRKRPNARESTKHDLKLFHVT